MSTKRHSYPRCIRRIPRMLWELGRTWWVYPDQTLEDIITNARLSYYDLRPSCAWERVELDDDQIIEGLRKMRGVG